VSNAYYRPMSDNLFVHDLGALANTMGAELIEATPLQVRMRLPVAGNTQPVGLLHGGANGVLIEHAGSILASFHAPEGRIPVGTELSVSQLRSALTGHVTATATVLSEGRSSFCAQVHVRDDAGVLTAAGRLTAVYVRNPGA